MSPGVLQLTATDSKGRSITKLRSQIQISLALRPGLDDLSDEEICLASSGDEKGSEWECDEAETRRRTVGQDNDRNKRLTLRRSFDHFTSFAVLLDTSSSCEDGYWIASVTLMASLPTCCLLMYFALVRTQRGKALLYGYHGASLDDVVQKIDNAQHRRS